MFDRRRVSTRDSGPSLRKRETAMITKLNFLINAFPGANRGGGGETHRFGSSFFAILKIQVKFFNTDIKTIILTAVSIGFIGKHRSIFLPNPTGMQVGWCSLLAHGIFHEKLQIERIDRELKLSFAERGTSSFSAVSLRVRPIILQKSEHAGKGNKTLVTSCLEAHWWCWYFSPILSDYWGWSLAWRKQISATEFSEVKLGGERGRERTELTSFAYALLFSGNIGNSHNLPMKG